MLRRLAAERDLDLIDFSDEPARLVAGADIASYFEGRKRPSSSMGISFSPRSSGM